MRLFIFNLIIIAVVSNTSIAQEVEQSIECPFSAIHRIVIKNDSVVSFYSLNSASLKSTTWYKSNTESLDKIINIKNKININHQLYLIYNFIKKNGECISYCTNFPCLECDFMFIEQNIFYNGRKEDETFSMDFWQENINKEEIKIVPYDYHK
ncbi:MAG: hypothetical protein U9R42_14560 [Bacteroidota bacterium]|nr:hypothetical protein [Bacteroidota bacterium]